MMDHLKEQRLKAALAFMDTSNLDLLIAASTDSIQCRGNVRYLTNYATNYGISIAILHRRGKLVLLVPDGSFQLGWAKDMAWADEIFAVNDFRRPIVEQVGGSGTEGLIAGIAGLEDLPGSLEEQLRSSLRGVKFERVSSSFKLMKAVKSATELNMAKESVSLADLALGDVATAIQDGRLESELFAKASFRLAFSGAETYFLLGSTGTRTVSPIPDGRAIREGDVLRFSIEPASPGGFWTQTIRMYCLKQSAVIVRQAFDLCVEALEQATEMVRPGLTGGDIARTMIAVLNKAGTGLIGPLGHGMGLDLTEPPYMLPTDETLIKPGMVITIHPSLIWGEANIWMGDTFLVTEDKPEKLSNLPNELFVL